MKTIKSPLMLILSLLTLLSPLARAEKYTLDCYLDDLKPCQGCSNIEISYDTEAKAYSMQTYNMSSGAGLESPLLFDRLHVTEYGLDAANGIRVTAKIGPKVRDTMELNSLTGFLAKAGRISLEVLPNRQSKNPEQIGTLKIQFAGLPLFPEKASCGKWQKQK